ncbi:MAG: carbohydrate ABC transporter permease [Blautia sp.]|nr:carbohydrate ABC transporter permease [Blautia sp.]
MKKKTIRRIIFFVLVWAVIIIYVMPLFWIVTTSFKTDADAYALPIKWLNFDWTTINYINVFGKSALIKNFWNSVIVALASSVIGLCIGVPAAYALSRFSMTHKNGLSTWILSTRMAPPILCAIPYYILSKSLGIYDTHFLLTVMHILLILSWVVWMMQSFFDDVPIEVDESGMLDGCSRFQCMIRIMMPISRSGLTATFIYSIILSWNEYFFAMVLTSVKSQTLPASITSFLSVYGLMWGQMCAASTVIMLPILIFVFLMQNHLVRGLSMGAVKG